MFLKENSIIMVTKHFQSITGSTGILPMVYLDETNEDKGAEYD